MRAARAGRYRLFEHFRRTLPRVGGPGAFAAAACFIAIAVLARAPLEEAAQGALPPFITIYPAIVLASVAGGIRVGAIASIAGGLIAWRLWLTPQEQAVFSASVLTAGFFVLGSSISVAASGSVRLLLDRVSSLEAERAAAVRESIHRIKNLIAIVQATSMKIARQTNDQAVYLENFHQRLAALATAQDVLVRTDWRDADINDVVNSALAPFVDDPRLRIERGADLLVPAPIVAGLSLGLYELATNALKYGALARADGLATLSWRTGNERCIVEWRESGGGFSKGREGVGTALIRSAVGALKNARVDYSIDRTAVVCRFEWPCGRIVRGQPPRDASALPPAPPPAQAAARRTLRRTSRSPRNLFHQ